MATILIPIPSTDFDPTETAVPWRVLVDRGHMVRFATPDACPGRADERMLTGRGLGPLKRVLMADVNARKAYAAMIQDSEFTSPLTWEQAGATAYDALLLPGGHAPGMRPYLESKPLQELIVASFDRRALVAAICHGVLLAARARRADGKSVLWGRRTTALLHRMELTAWALTRLWLGDYYRTYPVSVQQEVTSLLADPADFNVGPSGHRRDSLDQLDAGFVLRDDNYLSARWPGDAHRFAVEIDTALRGV
ncbi:MAG: DJ-1/PfpI family protein [Proteobacteria bacterium]|nr:DJ-1/PfpI family protein [Pseudomonadota bacterium]